MSSVSICCRSSSLHQQYQPAEAHAGEGKLRHLQRKVDGGGGGGLRQFGASLSADGRHSRGSAPH